MVTFPFYCPVCQGMVDATADPVDLLFGGGQVDITCNSCERVFRADLELATSDKPAKIDVKGERNESGD